MDSGCLQSFLEEISKAYSENHLLVVLDGAPSHRSEQISVPRERRLCASSGLLSRARPGREMVPRVQARVVQQSLQDSRVSARGAGPGTSTLLEGYCSTPTAHWFLLVGGGCRCVMTSITRIGISPDLVIRSRVTAVVEERAANWIELYPECRSFSTFCIEGERRAMEDVQLSDLLAVCARVL